MVTREQWEMLYRYQPADTIEKDMCTPCARTTNQRSTASWHNENFKSESNATTAKNLQSALQQKKKEALKAYERRLQQSEYDCMIELLEVLAQDTIRNKQLRQLITTEERTSPVLYRVRTFWGAKSYAYLNRA